MLAPLLPLVGGVVFPVVPAPFSSAPPARDATFPEVSAFSTAGWGLGVGLPGNVYRRESMPTKSMAILYHLFASKCSGAIFVESSKRPRNLFFVAFNFVTRNIALDVVHGVEIFVTETGP